MARVTNVQRARAAYTCEKCGDPIPKGSPYKHATPGFRGSKKIRCVKPECNFRTSDLCTSNMVDAYVAQEAFEDEIGSAGSLEDVKNMLEAYAEGLRETAGIYEEASGNWAGGQNEEWDEKAEALNSAADELENFEWEPEEEESEEDIENAEDDEIEPDDDDLTPEQITEMIQAAEEHAGNVSFE